MISATDKGKFLLIYTLYWVSISLPLLMIMFVFFHSWSDLTDGQGINPYGVLCIVGVSIPCLVFWLVSRLALANDKRFTGNLLWAFIVMANLLTMHQGSIWSHP